MAVGMEPSGLQSSFQAQSAVATAAAAPSCSSGSTGTPMEQLAVVAMLPTHALAAPLELC